MKIELRNDSVVIDGYVNAVARDSRPILPRSALFPDGRCVEQIIPGTFRKSLEKRSAVELLINHDPNRRLGSTESGELELSEDSIGLRAHAVISDAEAVKAARNGDFVGWSFGMYVKQEEREERAGDIPRRKLSDIDLIEVSLIDRTMQPCYAGTSVECRADGETVTETCSFEDEITIREIPDFSEMEKKVSEIRAKIEISDYEHRLEMLKIACGAELRANPYHDPKNGRFTSGGNSSKGLTSGEKSVKLDSKGKPYNFPELRLSKKEYGKVIHEINTLYDTKYKGLKRSVHVSGNYAYRFEIHEFDEYNIFHKYKI